MLFSQSVLTKMKSVSSGLAKATVRMMSMRPGCSSTVESAVACVVSLISTVILNFNHWANLVYVTLPTLFHEINSLLTLTAVLLYVPLPPHTLYFMSHSLLTLSTLYFMPHSLLTLTTLFLMTHSLLALSTLCHTHC